MDRQYKHSVFRTAPEVTGRGTDPELSRVFERYLRIVRGAGFMLAGEFTLLFH